MQLDDLSLKLLKGEKIPFGEIMIEQISLSEVEKIGYSNYARMTNLLTIGEEDLIYFAHTQKIPDMETSPFKYLFEQSLKSPTFFIEVQLAFFTYLKKQPVFDFDKKTIKIPAKISHYINSQEIVLNDYFTINEKNFGDFQQIIRKINLMKEEPEEKEIKTTNLEMKEKFLKAREKLKLAKAAEKYQKAKEGKEITFPDMVSSLCAFGTGYTLFNIWDLTIYQFYDQFRRSQSKESYEMGSQMLLAGVDRKKVDLQYWMQKITL